MIARQVWALAVVLGAIYGYVADTGVVEAALRVAIQGALIYVVLVVSSGWRAALS